MLHAADGFHVIAEAGTNHAGQIDLGKRLIDIARDAHAHSVKFQIIYPEGLYLPETPTKGGYARNEVFDKRASMMLSDDDYRALADYAREHHIPMSASVFDERGVRLLESIDAPYLKFASCDLNNSRLLKIGAETGRPLVVSTGMATLGEIERALTDLTGAGAEDIWLLHCVSMYPAPLREMNLGMITALSSAFGMPVGLSDHTETSHAATMAVALGARLFEKHHTYDRAADGFDHAYAMEPGMLKGYVRDIGDAISALKPAPLKLRESESLLKPRARRGIHAARDIQPGDIITETDLVVVRPEGPMSPNELPIVIGAKATRAIRRFESVEPGMLA